VANAELVGNLQENANPKKDEPKQPEKPLERCFAPKERFELGRCNPKHGKKRDDVKQGVFWNLTALDDEQRGVNKAYERDGSQEPKGVLGSTLPLELSYGWKEQQIPGDAEKLVVVEVGIDAS